MNQKPRTLTPAFLLLLGWMALSGLGNAQYTETILHNFVGGTNDAGQPSTGLIQASDGNFYGTASVGGAYATGGFSGNGVVYEMNPSGSVTILHSFPNPNFGSDGSNPLASLIQASNGYLYGTTVQGGGANGDGTIFKILPGGGSYSTVASFSSSTGGSPRAELLQGRDGNLYGTLSQYGQNSGGAVFNYNPTSGVVTYLHEFVGGASDGSNPFASLVEDSSGNFYGTTVSGGSASLGTVFKMTVAGGVGTVTVLHSFGSVTNDGNTCYEKLILGSDGNLYGTTESGGSDGYGIVFKIISPSATANYTILHNFGDGSVVNDGLQPRGGLIQLADGNFYGITDVGGAYQDGTAYKITPSGNVSILYSFGNPNVNNGNDGKNPLGAIQGIDSSLYGTTAIGGSATQGTVYKISGSALPRYPTFYADTPTMPLWALTGLGLFIFFVAACSLRGLRQST